MSLGPFKIIVSSPLASPLVGKANTADLAPVATSGAYADLTGKPTLGTASAQPTSAFATAAQGVKADTAVQPADLAAATSAAVAPLSALIPEYRERPGDARSIFSTALTGDPLARAIITQGTVVASTQAGSVLRITGADVDGALGYIDVAPRIAKAIYDNTSYLLTFKIRRNNDPVDPENNAIECRWQNLNYNKASVSNVRLGDAFAPSVADGIVTYSFVIGKIGSPGPLDYTIPATSMYGVPHFRIYGNGQETDVIAVMTPLDVTSDSETQGNVDSLDGRVDAVEAGIVAQNLRIDELETEVDAAIETFSSLQISSGEDIYRANILYRNPAANGAVARTVGGQVFGWTIPAGQTGAGSFVLPRISILPRDAARLAGSTVRIRTIMDASANFLTDSPLAGNKVRVELNDGTVLVNVGTVLTPAQVGNKIVRDMTYVMQGNETSIGANMEVSTRPPIGTDAYFQITSVVYDVVATPAMDAETANDKMLSKRIDEAVAPINAKIAYNDMLSRPTRQANYQDRSGGTSIEIFDADNIAAGIRMDADGVFETIDTLNKKQKTSYAQEFSKPVTASAPVIAQDSFSLGGSEPQVGAITTPYFEAISQNKSLTANNGELIFGFDGKTGDPFFHPQKSITQTDGYFWRHPSGQIRAVNKVGWYTGQHSYLSEPVPPPQCILRPVVRYPDETPELATRVYILIPSVSKIGTRLFFAWCGDAVHPEEGAGNFIILAYSDDEGLTKTEFAYVLHPEADKARTMMPQLWVDQYGKLQLIFSMNYAFDGIAGGDDRHGVWNLPINDAMGAKPRCGRAWQVSTYGIPGRPVWVDDRFLVNVDLVENATSGLPVPGPISYWRGKSIFSIDTATRSAVKVGFVPNSTVFASYQESSTVQLRDGSLLAMCRTRTPGSAPFRSAQISRSPDGDPNNFGPLADFAALPPNPTTRAAMVMSANGRPLVAFNNDPSQRTSMTLAVLNDDATAILQSVLIDQMAGVATSYPSVWCDGDNIYIIYDGGRDSAKQITLVKVSESALLAGTATPTYHMIEDQ